MSKNSVEAHPDRGRIEYDIGRGVPVRVVAHKYGISKDAAYRYKKRMPAQLKAALYGNRLKAGADLEKLRIDESEGLLANLAMQRARLLLTQDAAMDAGNLQSVATLAGQIHRNIELVGKYLGEFAQHQVHTTISVLVTPEYLNLRAALIRALGSFPEARKSVAAVLHQVEGEAARRQPLMIESTANKAIIADAEN